MTITLGSVTLNDHISWRQRYNQGAPGSERTTLGGRLVVNRLTGQNNSDIILEAADQDNVRKGYFTKAQLVALAAYRDAGTEITLNYHGESITVVIGVQGIAVEKFLWKSQDTDDEMYLGAIVLKRVV